jgi:hypothetical protein
MQLKHLALAGLACVLSIPEVVAKPPDVTFLCDKNPEICSNMCYAVRCANPKFPQTLTFDFPDKNTTEARHKLAGCGLCNKCTKQGRGEPGHRGAPNTACIEYPFANTEEASDGHQVSRCVPAEEKMSAEDTISDLEKKWKEQGKTEFRINFGNPGAAKYCGNDPCDNDGFEVQDGEVGDEEKPKFKYYNTKSGMVIGSMDTVESQTKFTRRVDIDELVDDAFESWMEDSTHGQVRMMVDIFLHELPGDVFSSHV